MSGRRSAGGGRSSGTVLAALVFGDADGHDATAAHEAMDERALHDLKAFLTRVDISQMLRSGAEKTVAVAPSRDAEGRLVMLHVDTSAPGQATSRPLQSSPLNGDAEDQTAESSGASDEDEEEGEDVYIETRDLCARIDYELKQHSIPQRVFAKQVLGRSQGTLSDLLRRPRPWPQLTPEGRETFRRMFQWLKQPLQQRLDSVAEWRAGHPEPKRDPTSKLAKLEAELKRGEADGDGLRSPPRFGPAASPRPAKRRRLVFTDAQRRTLEEAFRTDQRPSKDTQQELSEGLGLDLSTVANFFLNSRRRLRLKAAAEGRALPGQLSPVAAEPAPLLLDFSNEPPAKKPALEQTME